jgi:AbrB family looped-hinge helix DNA binding protein
MEYRMSMVMKVQERGQITLPKRLREDMGLQPGDSVVAVPIGGGGYRLEPLKPMSIYEMFERWGDKTPRDSVDVERMIQAAQEEEAEEAARRILGE